MQENLDNKVSEPINSVKPVIQTEQPKQSSFLVILLSILLLISVSVAGFFAYQTQKLVKQLTAYSEQVKPTLTPEPQVNSDLTANWKTYTETREVRFSIKYPSDWIISTKDGMYGEKGATFDSDKLGIGSVSIGWNSQPVESNCNTGTEKKELIQIKGRKIEMCHSLGSTQEPEGYFYNSTKGGINYSIVTSNYPGVEKRNFVLSVLSTLEI